MKVLVTTHPFTVPVDGFNNVTYNTKKMKYTQREILSLLKKVNPEIIIAGTENYGKQELDLCSNLKLISRVGIGVSSINLQECKKRNIKVYNTPDAPTNAVAELTIAFILSALRLHNQKIWKKSLGRELSECVIGIVGYGRIGKKVEKHLKSFSPKGVLVNDIEIEDTTTLEEIYRESDIITFHVPKLSKQIEKSDFSQMKEDVILVNTSRGEIFNEKDLYKWLVQNNNAIAALDVFENEPYDWNSGLSILKNVIMTPHIGSYTKKARHKMETEAIKNIQNA